jgi:uncharacterized membrane protein
VFFKLWENIHFIPKTHLAYSSCIFSSKIVVPSTELDHNSLHGWRPKVQLLWESHKREWIRAPRKRASCCIVFFQFGEPLELKFCVGVELLMTWWAIRNEQQNILFYIALIRTILALYANWGIDKTRIRSNVLKWESCKTKANKINWLLGSTTWILKRFAIRRLHAWPLKPPSDTPTRELEWLRDGGAEKSYS